jgi:hypothetical protein
MATATVNIPTQISNHANLAAFPVTGALKTLYIAEDTEKLYRWNGSSYVEVSAGSGGEWGTIAGTLSNQTDLQTALDNKVDENAAITGATKTKITYDAKGLVTAGADATTADIADSSNARYVTDAQLTVIQNTSGTNTGDNATNTTSNSYADGKIAQTITNGVTDKAPSEDAVFDALALKQNIVSGVDDTEIGYLNGVTSSIQTQLNTRVMSMSNSVTSAAHTGTLVNTAVSSLLIPANTMKIGMAKVIALYDFNGVAAIKNIRLYINTTNSLSGATSIGLFNTTAGGSSMFMARNLAIKSATNIQITTASFSGLTPEFAVVGGNMVVNIAYNANVDNYIIAAIQLNDVNDIGYVNYINFQL